MQTETIVGRALCCDSDVWNCVPFTAVVRSVESTDWAYEDVTHNIRL